MHMTIQKVFILKDGILLMDKDFKGKLNVEMRLLSGFISATQALSKEMTGASMRNINFGHLTFHFYLDKKVSGLFYVIVTDNDYDVKEIECKILKISSLFNKHYFKVLINFNGDVSPFSPFNELLSKNKIHLKYCGDRRNCIACEYRKNTSINIKDHNRKDLMNRLTKWLNFLKINLSELLAAFIIDYDGFLVAQNTKKSLPEGKIEQIINILEPIQEQVNKSSVKPNISGILDTEGFQLFHLEMRGQNSALLVLIFEPSYKIQKSLAFIYFIAENISSVLNGYPPSNILLQINKNEEFSLPQLEGQNNSRDLLYPTFIIGDTKCGKTTIVNKFVNNKLIRKYKPTIGVSIQQKIYQISHDIQITFLFFDMGGFQTNLKVRKRYYKLVLPKILIGVFDLSQYSSINKLKDLIEESIYFFGNKPESVILVGNKTDKGNIEKKMETHISSIKKQYDCPYFEISALKDEGIEKILTFLISSIDLN
mgnify:CR=1 FL=1